MKITNKEKAIAKKIMQLEAQAARMGIALEKSLADRRLAMNRSYPGFRPNDEQLVPISFTEARRWMDYGLPKEDRKDMKQWYCRLAREGRDMYEMDTEFVGKPVIYAKDAEGGIWRYRGPNSVENYSTVMFFEGHGTPPKRRRKS
ncbi:MAG: hypothetical protein EBR40_10075 [Proteobacteria bacterium]|nr:hypothetical protein [Pseudomonadota bacterium]